MCLPFLIIGLGNPGRDYLGTRHNAGFLAVEHVAGRLGSDWRSDKRFTANLAQGEHAGRRLIFCRPETYMNASGDAVARVTAYFKVDVERILVVVDDADIPFGTLRLRPGGSSGGHRGLKSVEQRLGTQEYARLRIGIGRRDQDREIAGYVLSRFSRQEQAELDPILARVADQIICWLEQGVALAMNRYNGPVIDKD